MMQLFKEPVVSRRKASGITVNDEKPKTFRGDRLRWARDQLNLTQEELNDICQFSGSQISRYETGSSEPQAPAIFTIAKALDVTSDYLLGLSDDPEGYGPKSPLSPKEKVLLARYEAGDLTRLVYELLGEALVTRSLPPSEGAEGNTP